MITMPQQPQLLTELAVASGQTAVSLRQKMLQHMARAGCSGACRALRNATRSSLTLERCITGPGWILSRESLHRNLQPCAASESTVVHAGKLRVGADELLCRHMISVVVHCTPGTYPTAWTS